MEEDVEGLIKAADDTRRHDHRLRDLLTALNEIRDQVLKRSEAANIEINETFAALSQSLLENVEKRRNELLKKVETIKGDTLGPLVECRDTIENKLKRSQDAAQRVVCASTCSENDLAKLAIESPAEIESLPEIPKLSDVPSISVHFNASAIQQCVNGILYLGQIAHAQPVTIIECREKPGALAIRWEESDTDFLFDLEDVQFRLQCCEGTVCENAESEGKFLDAYIGADTCCMVRGLKLDSDYSFRVCRLGTDEAEWSCVQVARTTIPPYEWSSFEVDDYELGDEGRIATKITRSFVPVHSGGPQFQRGHSLQLSIVKSGTCARLDEGLGLALMKASSECGSIRPGTIFVNCEGSIFVDGVKTSTQLPHLLAGSVLTFESEEELPNDKMRVMITCEGKRVTYDWRVDAGSSEQSSRAAEGIYFFMHFGSEGWRVRVD